jgi:hypothetical protein
MAFDDFDEAPSGSFWQKWFGGIAFPVVLVSYGFDCILTREAVWWGRPYFSGQSLQLHGLNACLFGTAALAIGLFAHFHYFWGSVDRLEEYSVPGKIAALLLFLASFAVLIARVVVFG